MKLVFAYDPREWKDDVLRWGGVSQVLVSFFYTRDKGTKALGYGRPVTEGHCQRTNS